MGFGAPTITRTPVAVPADNVISAYDPVMFELSWAGDPITSIKAKRMQAEVFVTSSNTSLGTMKKESIDIGGGTIRYRFNISDMLKTVLEAEFFNNITSDSITSGNDKLATEFHVTFTPLFTDSLGTVQIDPSTTSSTYFVGNGIIQPIDILRVFNASSPVVLGTNQKQFLTNAPDNLTLFSGEDYQLSFYYLGSLQLELNFQTFDLGGNANIAQTVALKTIVNKEGSFTISDNGSSTMLDDFANISKVDVWIEESDGTQISEKRRFLISQDCVQGTRLLWMNSLGAIDKHTFTAHQQLEFKVNKRVNYTKPMDDTPTREERATVTLNVKGNNIFTATSGILTKRGTFRFRDLLNSTLVYLQDGNVLSPVVIRSMEQVIFDSDELIQVVIEFEVSQMVKTHVG